MFVRLSVSILALLLCLAAPGWPRSVAAQTGPGPAIETDSVSPAARSDDPVAVAGHGRLFDANMKLIDPSPEFLRRALDLPNRRDDDALSDP